jgi:hypothetical protein
MKVRVPAWAPIIPPDMGESTKFILKFLASALNCFEAVGAMVEQSIIVVPALAFLKIPPSEFRISSTSLVAGTEKTT